MNMKRFATTILAGAMALSMAAPAFAASTTPAYSTAISGTYQDIPIAVVVPTTGTAQINPYGLPVTITKSNESTVDLTGQKITTRPLSIKNQGKTSLDVKATLAVIPKGDVSIAAAATAAKAIAVNLEVAGLDDNTLAVSSESETLEDLLIDKFAARSTWVGAATLAAPTAAKGAAAAAVTPAVSASTMATLGAATINGDAITYGKDSIALFRLTGDVNQEPTDAWATADGFTANVVFKFTPTAPSAGDATLTLDNTTITATGAIAATFTAGTSGRTVVSYQWTKTGAAAADVTLTNDTTATVTATIASPATVASNTTATITVTATLDNGATLTADCTYTTP